MNSIRILAGFFLLANSAAFAGDNDKKTIAPLPPEDGWQFKLALPGWIPWQSGEMGLHGTTSHVQLGPNDIIPKIDMIADVRAEAHKGRFSVMGEFLYMSLSDGIGANTVVKKLDVRMDQTMGDLGFGWRVIDSPRGWLDMTAGVRYTNIYQRLTLQPDSARIGEVSTALVDAVGDRLRTALSESGLRDLVRQKIDAQLAALKGQRPTVPSAPIGGGESGPIRDRIQQIIDARKAELAAAIQARAQAATAALQAQAQARIDGIKSDLSKRIARTLESKLDARLSRTDDWFDPYIGLRGRYNLNDQFYIAAKGDIGGFTVGCDVTWTAEAAIGWQLAHNLYTEVGYRAIGLDYNKDGYVNRTITHGPQVTLGITF